MQSRPLSMIPIGGPGAGKSTVLNFLIGIPQTFKSSRTSASGETKKISSKQGRAFNKEDQPMVKIFDVPGVGDQNIPLQQIVADIKLSIGSENPIDAAMLVVKSSDYRMDIQQTISIKMIGKYFENFDAKKVFLVYTHCDMQKPTDKEIVDKIAAYKQYGKIDISRENVVFFNNTAESLEGMVQAIKPGNMHFLEPEQLIKATEEILKELPGDFAKQDKAQGTNNQEMFVMLMEMMKEQSLNFAKMMQESSKQVADLAQAIASMPRGSDVTYCNLF